jgi:hypothetical protein
MTQLVRKTDDEAGALVRLGFEELRGFTESIGTMERDIAGRAFRRVPLGTPIKFVHDTIAGGVVGALGGAASAAGRGAQTLVERRPRPERPLSATVPGGMGLAFLNGLVGDRLEREGSPLQQPMAVRVGGLPVPPAAARARPRPSRRRRRGSWCSSTASWARSTAGCSGAARAARTTARASRATLGCTPVYIRYNTGRHISENGRSLPTCSRRWSTPGRWRSTRSRSVGHSMGGPRLAQRLLLRRARGRRAGSRTSAT